MVNVSGRGKVEIPPMYEESDKLDIQIEYARKKTLILTATNYLIKQAMWPLRRGDMVKFTGLLDESEPGYYYIKLSSLEKVSRS